MSKYKDQQRQQIEEEERQVRRRRWLAVIGSVLVLAAGVAIWHRDTNTSKVNAAFSQKPADEKWNLAALLALTPSQLGELDVGLVNLLCAEGLRGSENLDLAKSLGRLDEMAKRSGRKPTATCANSARSPLNSEIRKPISAWWCSPPCSSKTSAFDTARIGHHPSGRGRRTINFMRTHTMYSCTVSPGK